MPETTVDARGQICPKPLIMTKRALDAAPLGAEIAILVDNDTSAQNVERYLSDNGMLPRIERDGDVTTLRVAKAASRHSDAEPLGVLAPPAGSLVVLLAADVIGRGPPELGAVLMKGFLAALQELTPPPSRLVFYSSAVLLAVDGSPHVDAIRAIEARGVEVLICGTCADWYGKKADIHLGTVTNMLTILQTLAGAGKILSP